MQVPFKKFFTKIGDFGISSYLLDYFKIISESEFVVCSNSTFCWWASVIGNSNFVTIPRNWYADGYKTKEFIGQIDKIFQI